MVPAALALSLGAEGAEGAGRAKAKVDCTPAEHRYVYDCTIMLTGKKSGTPIAGAEVVVGADGELTNQIKATVFESYEDVYVADCKM